jgi:hypothetical protein
MVVRDTDFMKSICKGKKIKPNKAVKLIPMMQGYYYICHLN